MPRSDQRPQEADAPSAQLRWSGDQRGRWQVRPFCPNLASSSHHSCSRWSGWACAMAASFAPSCFFEGGLGGSAAVWMSGPRLLPGQTKAFEQPAHAPDAVVNAVGFFGMSTDVHHPPGTYPIPLRVGATQYPGLEGRLLPRRQPSRPARLRPIVQPIQPFGIVAHHRIVQRLALHPGQPGGFRTGQAIQSIGDRQQAHRRPPVRFGPS
jgi:hypothetical protein